MSEITGNELGRRLAAIRVYRDERMLAVASAASRVGRSGLSAASISDIEKGKTDPRKDLRRVRWLCEHYGVDEADVLNPEARIFATPCVGSAHPGLLELHADLNRFAAALEDSLRDDA